MSNRDEAKKIIERFQDGWFGGGPFISVEDEITAALDEAEERGRQEVVDAANAEIAAKHLTIDGVKPD